MPFIFHSSCYSAPSSSCLYYCNHFHTGLPRLQFLPYTNTICPHWIPCSNILLSPCHSPRQSTHARAHTQLSLLSSTMQTKSSLLVLAFKALPPSSMGPNLPFPIISYHCPTPSRLSGHMLFTATQIHHPMLIATPIFVLTSFPL